MSHLLIMALSLIISGGLFALLHFHFKRKWYLSLLLSLFSLLVCLFIFDLNIKTSINKKGFPPLYALVDNSLSQGSDRSYIAALETIIPQYRIFYFPDKGHESVTALHDYISLTLDKIESQSKLLVISDFRDNNSYNEVQADSRVIPLIYQEDHQDQSSIVSIKYQERIQSGNKSVWDLEIYSHDAHSISLEVRENTTILKSQNMDLKKGINHLRLSMPLYGEGYRLLEFSINDKSDSWTNNNTYQILHNLAPSDYSILLVAGRPSTELAHLRRFLEELKWMDVDTRILVKRGEDFAIPAISSLNKYDAVIVMDIKDRQITSLTRLSEYNKRILYIPGMQDKKDISGLLNFFGIPDLAHKKQETRIKIAGEPRVISTAFQTRDYLLEDKHIVFLGWDTWKWDFMMLALNLELDSYSGFWKNIMISLIDQGNNSLYQDRLNYKAQDWNPLDVQETGLYNYTTNGFKLQFFLQPAYEEQALIHADTATAEQYNTNVYYLNQGMDWKNLSDSLRPNNKVVWQEEIHFSIRNNKWVLLAMALIISLYWFLSDRLILKS